MAKLLSMSIEHILLKPPANFLDFLCLRHFTVLNILQASFYFIKYIIIWASCFFSEQNIKNSILLSFAVILRDKLLYKSCCIVIKFVLIALLSIKDDHSIVKIDDFVANSAGVWLAECHNIFYL